MGAHPPGIPARDPDGQLDGAGHGTLGAAPGEDAARAALGAKEGTRVDPGHLCPRLDRPHRAGLGVEAAEDAEQPAPSLLVRVGAPEAGLQPLWDQLQVLQIEGGQLGAAQPAGEAAQEQGPVAQPPEGALRDGGERLSEGRGLRGGLAPGSGASSPVGAADPGEHCPYLGVPGGGGVAGRLAGHGDGGRAGPGGRRRRGRRSPPRRAAAPPTPAGSWGGPLPGPPRLDVAPQNQTGG